MRDGELPSPDYTHQGGGKRPPVCTGGGEEQRWRGGRRVKTEWGDKGEAQTETIISVSSVLTGSVLLEKVFTGLFFFFYHGRKLPLNSRRFQLTLQHLIAFPNKSIEQNSDRS